MGVVAPAVEAAVRQQGTRLVASRGDGDNTCGERGSEGGDRRGSVFDTYGMCVCARARVLILCISPLPMSWDGAAPGTPSGSGLPPWNSQIWELYQSRWTSWQISKAGSAIWWIRSRRAFVSSPNTPNILYTRILSRLHCSRQLPTDRGQYWSQLWQ